MHFYYLNLAILSFLCLFEVLSTKKIGRTTLFLFLAYLTIFDALRVNTGTDWQPYFDHFSNISDSEVNEVESFETGYKILVKLISNMGGGYNAVLFAVAVITYFGIFYQVYRFGGGIPGIVLLYSIFTPLLGANRQIIAIGILVLALPFVFDRRFFYFVLSLLLASAFHVSALLFFPVYFIASKSVKTRYVLFLVVGAAVALLAGFNLNEILFLFKWISPDKIAFYSEFEVIATNSPLNGSVKVFVLLLFPIILVFLGGVWGDWLSSPSIKFFGKSVLFSLVIYLVSFMGMNTLNSRGAIYYFGIFLPLYLGYFSLYMPRSFDFRILYALFIIGFSFFQLHLGLATYPDLFFPYESVFDDGYLKTVY